MGQKSRGVIPIVTVVLMIVIVTALAGSTIYFLQTRQESITTKLSQALDEQLEVENIHCNGHQLSVYFDNTGDTDIESGRADLIIYREGEVDGNFSTKRLALDGSYLDAGGEGYLNLSLEGIFRSGTLYTIELDLTGTRSKFRELCRGGSSWWDLEWDYRRQIQISGPGEASSAVTSVEINSSRLIGEGKLEKGCTNLRVVEGGRVSQYNVTDCDSSDTRVYFVLRDLESGGGFDTYLYYGNLRAKNMSSGNLGEINPDLSTELEREEELQY
ncbi:MAG: hypothetical protein SVV03_05750 [Candidatus Nanohaloarchaea archaeon]|nr:hypothetical protein [Candidatus Nanohaloarchaea archaeon]